jgi:hypothetical protein
LVNIKDAKKNIQFQIGPDNVGREEAGRPTKVSLSIVQATQALA